MNRFREYFGDGKVFLPVIHLDGNDPYEGAIRNADIAFNAGADGVFIIEHTGRVRCLELMLIRDLIEFSSGGLFVGTNFLDLCSKPTDIFKPAITLCNSKGIWSDITGINSLGPTNLTLEMDKARLESKWSGIYFGSVAFKYQDYIPFHSLSYISKIATSYMDVIVTSGEATGKAADPNRVWAMKQSLGDFPLAIASGVTIGNVNNYLDLVDCFMVNSSIGLDFHNLDSKKTKELCRAVKGLV